MVRWEIAQTVDLQKGAGVRVWTEALMLCGDNAGHRIAVTVTDGGQPADLSGYSVTAYFVRSDGVSVMVQGETSGSVAAVTMTAECYAVGGAVMAAVRLSRPGQVMTVLTLALYVREVVTDSIADVDGALISVDELLELGAAVSAAVQKIEGMTVAVNTLATGAAATASYDAANGRLTLGIPRGDVGATPAISIGTVQTGAAGSAASATIGGTVNAPVLNLVLPQGAPNIVKGHAFATVEALASGVTAPAEGDMYNVGAAAPYNVYRWTGTVWEDQGQTQGVKGDTGAPGADGASAYEVAVAQGYAGTAAQWLASLHGADAVVEYMTDAQIDALINALQAELYPIIVQEL